MPRYRIIVEYNGAAFAGWQKNKALPSVQETLEEAIWRFCGERVQVTGAGRTDAGVHALGQLAHFDLVQAQEPFTIMNALNYHLLAIAKTDTPQGVYGERQVAVMAAEAAPDDFHARFSAKGRHYRYRILNRRPPPVIDAAFVWHVPEALDISAMQEAAKLLLGHHDFTSFRDTQCQAKSPLKTLDRFDVAAQGEEIHLCLSARSFLHHQVRIMAGSLKWVGSGRWNARHIAQVLEDRDRTKGGPTAPAQGLCLLKVDY